MAGNAFYYSYGKILNYWFACAIGNGSHKDSYLIACKFGD